jgi:cell division septation protein DedD
VVFAIGVVGLGISVLATVSAYSEAEKAGQMTVSIAEQARMTQMQQNKILADLREIEVDREMPRWRLAERILLERALPWSRLTAELERSLVQDVRLKSIQRTRDNDQRVQLKVRGDAKSEAAETNFIESLQENLAFASVILERDAEVQNSRGMWEFDYTLQLSTAPPLYELLPKYGPSSSATSPRTQATPASAPAQAQQPQPVAQTQNPPAAQGSAGAAGAANRQPQARAPRQQGNPPRGTGGRR